MLYFGQSTHDIGTHRGHYQDFLVALPKATSETGLDNISEAIMAFLVGLTFDLTTIEDHILDMADVIRERREPDSGAS